MFETGDWSRNSNGGPQTGIVVRNTFIDVCPLEEDSDGDNPSPHCASPHRGSPHRRNLSAPPSSPSRRGHHYGPEFVDSDQEEEEDPGSIPSYQYAPDKGLLKAEDEDQGMNWLPSPPSPKKVPGKPKKPRNLEAAASLSGARLSGVHGPRDVDPYAAHGLTPATGGDAGSRFCGLGGLGSGGGLGSMFSGGGLGVFGTAGGGGMVPSGLSTAPTGGFGLTEGYGPSPGLGYGLTESYVCNNGTGAGLLGAGFDPVALGGLGRSLGGPTGMVGMDPLLGGLPGVVPGVPGVEPLLGGLSHFGGCGFSHLGREMPAPPMGPPTLNLSSQVLSNERLSTAPTTTSGPHSGAPQGEAGSAYISEHAPMSAPLTGHIPIEAPAYVLRNLAGNAASTPATTAAPLHLAQQDLGQVDAGSRRPSMQAVAPTQSGWAEADTARLGRGAGDLGGMAGYLNTLGVAGNGVDHYTAEGSYMDAGSTVAYGLGLDTACPPGPWAAAGAATQQSAHAPWLGPGVLQALEQVDVSGHGGRMGRGKGGGRGQGKSQRGEDPSGSGAAADREAKGRVPLSGGGPKRTDYIKKYGGVPEPDHNAGQYHNNNNNNNNGNNANVNVPITTMMLKNIPCRKGQEEVMMHIDQKGFGNRYDFFYLPRDVKFRANLGYAFINFLTPEDAENFSKEMNGYRFSTSGSMKACQVVPAHVQGLMNNLAAFKRTEVMRSSRRPFFSTMVNV